MAENSNFVEFFIQLNFARFLIGLKADILFVNNFKKKTGNLNFVEFLFSGISRAF